MVSKKQDCVICVGWGIYSTICKLELEFPWKSNVVWDLCGSKDFEKRGQWAQESEIKAIWLLENLKLLYDEEGGFFAIIWIDYKWSLAQARMKFGECIWHTAKSQVSPKLGLGHSNCGISGTWGTLPASSTKGGERGRAESSGID
jgi:hypothetical protein